MSLDVYLISEEKNVPCICSECGHTHTRKSGDLLFHYNITHNLNHMASEAGIYNYLWAPEEVKITKAWELIAPLSKGLSLLKSEPDMFKKYNADNGWGTYENLVKFVEEYIIACVNNTNANIKVSR